MDVNSDPDFETFNFMLDNSFFTPINYLVNLLQAFAFKDFLGSSSRRDQKDILWESHLHGVKVETIEHRLRMVVASEMVSLYSSFGFAYKGFVASLGLGLGLFGILYWLEFVF